MNAFSFQVFTLLLICSVSTMAQDPSNPDKEPIRIGMIGLDTSHATAFTKILNGGEVPGAKVIAGVPQSSPDMATSHTRLEGYVEELEKEWGVKMFDSIEEMLPHVDAVMVESVDGRPHLRQAAPAIKAGKKVFIDKPMAASLSDVIQIFELAEEHGVPVWSASNLRYHEGIVAAQKARVGEITMALSYGPSPIEKTHPDLAWYGIHPVEALFTVMGPEVRTVQRTHTPGTDLVTGTWDGDRIGTVMGIRAGKRAYGIKVFGTRAIVEESAGAAYPQLMRQVVKFFETGNPPVSPEETIAIFAFIEAADLSRDRDGAPVSIEEVIRMARKKLE